MDKLSFLGNIDAETIDAYYKKYKENPDSVDSSWQFFFKGFDFAITKYDTSGALSEQFDKEFKVINLIDGYRKRGHLFTQTNPVRTRRKYWPKLDIENYGLKQDELNENFHAGKEITIGTAPLKKIIEHLKKTYCSSIGSEYMFIRQPEKIKWLQEKIEKTQNSSRFSVEEQKNIFYHLVQGVGFEKFIHKKFTGQKRFSLEGTEALVPGLHAMIEKGADMDVKEFVIGMAHRGRLNVLGNILQKPYENIFNEFVAEEYVENISLGDVKYHLGYDNEITTESGKKVQLNLAPNPSHLEAVGPVIQGISRGKIDRKFNGNNNNLIPVIIHGDAAIAGQGVVYEVIQMSELEGYKTGGTLHFVINNQIGFTTNYLDGRSSTYCTDVGKVTKSPIFHVNGDDVEALVHTIRLAIEYRQKFHTDVFIDILSYRKYGHNEGDEPRFTQPILYKSIASHPNPRDMYAQKLLERGIMTEDQIKETEKDFDSILEEKLEKARKIQKTPIKQFLHQEWSSYKYPEPDDFSNILPTGIKIQELKSLAKKINALPEEHKFFKKTHRLIEERNKIINNNQVDWAMAELLAYGSLLNDKVSVRISGQDSIRGTFAHRHASHTIEDTDKTFTPLKYISEKQADFHIYNSPLNEYGVLGFEYGHALSVPGGLTIWEAQFGDFINVAQVIIDQYISSAEEKWGLMNGIVLYLPHGFEGQGPEHSSARIERFLSVAANGNIQLLNLTTPANLFHALRNHIHRNYKVPVILFTPKSLLRHPKCISSLNDLETGKFRPVIDDDDVIVEEVRRVVFCSGKIYYDLLKQKEKYDAKDLALIRIEQLHPLPKKEIREIKDKYYNAMLTLWVQEEPENMGAWYYINDHLKDLQLEPVTRLESASPAVGLSKIHNIQQNEILEKVFRKCDCELQNVYCGLQCVIGHSRKRILKQHKYFSKSQKEEKQVKTN